MDEENRKFQYLASFAVSLAALTIGMIQAWATPAIPKFHDNETNIPNITDSELSWIVSLTSPGFMVGSIFTRFISDRFGKRNTLLGSAIPVLIATVILLSASQAWMLCVSRFVFGFGMGMIGTVATIYVAEIASKEIRGTLSSGNRLMQNFGHLLVMAIGPFVSYRALNYLFLVFPIVYFIACWWIPETPYYLLKEGRVDAARKVLMTLNGYKDEKVLEDRLSSMREDVNRDMQNSTSFKELFIGKKYRRAIVIDVGLKMAQIMSGFLVLQQYLGRIMQESKTNMKVSTAIIAFGAVRFIVSLIGSILVDRVGRRPLFMFSYFGAGVSLAIVGTYFFCQEVMNMNEDILTTFGYVPFLGIISFYIISSLGFSILIFVIPAEIFPLNIKAVAMTSTNILGAVCNFIVLLGYQQVKDVVGLYGTFWLFASVCITGGIFTYFYVPETKGKSLREIQIELQGDLYDHTNENLKQVVTKLVVDEDANETTELKELERKES